MQDRVSLYPGRVKLEPVAGQANLYDLTRADQPTQEGTPLNKASLLKDATAALFGLTTDAVPDDALALIKTLIDSANSNANTKAKIATGSYIGTGTYGRSNPNSLTFDFEPKFVAVFGTSDSFQLFLLNGASYAFSVRKENSNTDNSAKTSPITVSFSGNSVSWYSKNSNIYQGNYTMSHNYIAIG